MDYHRLNIDELNKVVQRWCSEHKQPVRAFCAAAGRTEAWLFGLRKHADENGYAQVQPRTLRDLRPVFDELGISVDSILDDDSNEEERGADTDAEVENAGAADESPDRGSDEDEAVGVVREPPDSAPDAAAPSEEHAGSGTSPEGTRTRATSSQSSRVDPRNRGDLYTRDEVLARLIGLGVFSAPPSDVEQEALSAYMGENRLIDRIEMRGFTRLMEWLRGRGEPAKAERIAAHPETRPPRHADEVADMLIERGVFSDPPQDIQNDVLRAWLHDRAWVFDDEIAGFVAILAHIGARAAAACSSWDHTDPLDQKDELSDLIGEVFDSKFADMIEAVKLINDGAKAVVDGMNGVLKDAVDTLRREKLGVRPPGNDNGDRSPDEDPYEAALRGARSARPADKIVVAPPAGARTITISF